MEQFPNFLPKSEGNFGLLMNGTIAKDNWIFQNDLDLSKHCIYPLSPLKQLHYSPNCSGIFKQYVFSRKERESFTKLNPLLIPQSIIDDALEDRFPDNLFIGNLLVEHEKNILFPSGLTGSDLYEIDESKRVNCLHKFPVPINQISSMDSELVAIRLYDSVELFRMSEDWMNVVEIFSFPGEEPSNVSFASFPTNEMMMSSMNGVLTLFTLGMNNLDA